MKMCKLDKENYKICSLKKNVAPEIVIELSPVLKEMKNINECIEIQLWFLCV